MTRDLTNALARNGREVPVYAETDSGSEDAFGQSEKAWRQVDSVLASRSYQNRNTTMNNSNGERHRDRPVFFFTSESGIEGSQRIKYEGIWYELDAPTRHGTHTVAVGSEVIDEGFPA